MKSDIGNMHISEAGCAREVRIVMSKYEVKIKVAQIQSLVEEKKYRKAAALLATLDVGQVRSRADLHTFAEVYMKTEQFAAAKATYLRIYKKNRTQRILHRLIYLSIRSNDLDEAELYYEEYVAHSKNNRDNLILRFRLDKAKGVPVSQLIDTLRALKSEEYIEEWAYELAKLYYRAGRIEECRQECDDIKLWFGDGEIVDRVETLIKYISVEEQVPYYDDRDFTQQEEEAPNPDDTGSLPDLDPSIWEDAKRKEAQKRREQRALRKKKEEEDAAIVTQAEKEAEEEEYEMELEFSDISQMAVHGLKKLSGLWKRGDKTAAKDEADVEEQGSEGQTADLDFEQTVIAPEDMQKESIENDIAGTLDSEVRETIVDDELKKGTDKTPTSIEVTEEEWDSIEEPESMEEVEQLEPVAAPVTYPKSSASGTGITQDLSREIKAIFEMEHQKQLKEKAVNVVERMSLAIQKREQEYPSSATEMDVSHSIDDSPVPTMVGKPDGMEEIVQEAPLQKPKLQTASDMIDRSDSASCFDQDIDVAEILADKEEEEEITMIELDQIMPEPDMPEKKQVVPQDSPELGNQQELEDKDLPTTKALHRKFSDMLTLIAGEREPKNFVLMGDGENRILGVTKKIVRIMNRKKFMSTTQIARIDATQLNEMDLLTYGHQLEGSCLLVDHAAQLSFPAITQIFTLMDAFEGNFVVVLADEGSTLDELFKVAPALAHRFEYVIDVNSYTEEEYMWAQRKPEY